MAKILIFGDSIAYGKWDLEGGWVARLRMHIDKIYNLGKNGNIQIYNLGIPGEVAPRLAKRFETELKTRVFPDDKSLVILSIGLNDSCPNNWLTQKQTPEIEFKTAIESMITVAKNYGSEILILGLTPVNPEKSKGLNFTNEAVKIYDQYLTEIAQKLDVHKLDWYQDLIKQNFPDLLVDAAHPNSTGHQILAEKVISYLNQKQLIENFA